MGRNAGWIACSSGIAVAADYILVPGSPDRHGPTRRRAHQRRRAAGKPYGIVVVAEGAEFPDRGAVTVDQTVDPFGHARLGGIGHVLAQKLEALTGIETRAVVLGHLQRGGPPSAYDRVLATRLGLAASHLVIRKQYGTMVDRRGNAIDEQPLDEESRVTERLISRYMTRLPRFSNERRLRLFR